MKYISFGKFDKKFLIYFLLYVVAAILNTIFYAFVLMNQEHNSKNVPLNVILIYGFNIFFGIVDFIDRRKSHNLSKLDQNYMKFNTNDLELIVYTYPYKEINFQIIFMMSFFSIMFYVYNFFRAHITLIQTDKNNLIFNENHNAIAMVVFILLFRYIQKTTFYKHQYLSIIIIITLGIINHILNLIFGDIKIDYSIGESILIFFLVLIFPSVFAFLLYMTKRYMKFKYYSPLFLCFMVGLNFDFISIILLIYCKNIDFEISNICEPLDIDFKNIILLILDCILNGFIVLFQVLIINDYTVFHLMIAYCLKDMTDQILISIVNATLISIMTIIIKTIEFLFGLVFLEIIELNFCGLNINLKKSIIDRGDDEKKEIYKSISGNEDDSENRTSSFADISIDPNKEMYEIN